MEKKIQMVDLKTQYQRLKPEIDANIQSVISSAQFINGQAVKEFAQELAAYLDVKHVIPCANGTDALQIALMSIGAEEGDEIIVPAFTYIATAEVIALLGLTPVLADVDLSNFNILPSEIERLISDKTKAIIPVNLYGQGVDINMIKEIINNREIFIIEDNAQSIGADYGNKKYKTGTLSDLACTSFFPSKNLGCYGDGGAIYTNDDKLAIIAKAISSHGQLTKKYHHDIVGINSRLDSIQAAILQVKLRELDNFNARRRAVAIKYNEGLKNIDGLIIPKKETYSSHVYHQYTLRIKNGKRGTLKAFLASKNVPSMIYYPMTINQQKAYSYLNNENLSIDNSLALCEEVLSLPIHTEMENTEIDYIINSIKQFFYGI